MKQEYKTKIDEWVASRNTEELDYVIDSAHREFLKRNKEIVDKINKKENGSNGTKNH